MKRWVGAHQSQNGGAATTVYFDAFAHDYLSDPLVALVGALGTTESSRTRQINGVSNDEYDHPSYIRHLAWLYLCNEGDLGDNEDGRHIVKFFDDYGRLGRPSELPMRVYDLWLDLFRIP
ncbi:hypothetical protein I7F13_21985 [Sinorhizobium meliloti]|nr:hypothetical protein [Sinorhizobium meliloti]RVM39289.1 hypothetical protein CN127_33275 [Sinorhizobium meliloti]RVN57114.1 hypothetical protein CN106_33250 [Sinorhizobium meliloti]